MMQEGFSIPQPCQDMIHETASAVEEKGA